MLVPYMIIAFLAARYPSFGGIYRSAFNGGIARVFFGRSYSFFVFLQPYHVADSFGADADVLRKQREFYVPFSIFPLARRNRFISPTGHVPLLGEDHRVAKITTNVKGRLLCQ
jgi:hypothetical protein